MNYLSYIHTFTVQIIGISQKSEYFVLRASNFSVCRLSSICCICEYCSMLIVCLCFLCERYFPALWLVDCVCFLCERYFLALWLVKRRTFLWDHFNVQGPFIYYIIQTHTCTQTPHNDRSYGRVPRLWKIFSGAILSLCVSVRPVNCMFLRPPLCVCLSPSLVSL